MAETKERFWELEGYIQQRMVVQAKGKTLEEAVAAAERGDWDLVEELKSTDTTFFWYEDTDVKVSEDSENFAPYDPNGEDE